MFYFAAGYALAILFPIPFFNAFIISLWARFGSQLAAWIKGNATAVPTAPVAPTPTPTPPAV